MRKITLQATALVWLIAGLTLGSANGQQMPKMDHQAGHAMSPGIAGHAMSPGMKKMDFPTEAGQDAFGTIQEIVTLLLSDPETDWSKVNIQALREHLVDMNDLTLKSQATSRRIKGGLDIEIKGDGRTLSAIRRMIPAHAPMLAAETRWQVSGVKTEAGARLKVKSDDPAQVRQIQGLGFYGLMATGGHHQTHHLGIARGQMVHGGS